MHGNLCTLHSDGSCKKFQDSERWPHSERKTTSTLPILWRHLRDKHWRTNGNDACVALNYISATITITDILPNLKPVDVCIQKYLEFSKAVFRLDKKMVVRVWEGYSWFRAESLDKALKKVFLTIRICPCSFLRTVGKTPVRLSFSGDMSFYMDECPIWQAARPTIAALTSFPPAWVSVPPSGEWYVDGAVTQNSQFNTSKIQVKCACFKYPQVFK